MVKQTVYSGTKVVETAYRITGNDGYTTNTYYYNGEFKFVWYENSNGYIHILRPRRVKSCGEILFCGIQEFLLTKKDTLKEIGSIVKFESKEKLFETMKELHMKQVGSLEMF